MSLDDDEPMAADDSIDGTCCEVCGEFFDDVINGKKPPGHPRTCNSCKRDIEGDDDDYDPDDWGDYDDEDD